MCYPLLDRGHGLIGDDTKPSQADKVCDVDCVISADHGDPGPFPFLLMIDLDSCFLRVSLGAS